MSRSAAAACCLAALAAPLAAQTVDPASVVVTKGKTATITVSAPCESFMLPFVSPGFPGIFSATPEATLPTTSQEFVILGKKAGESEVSIRLLGEMLATGQGTCDTDEVLHAGVAVLDVKGVEKAYKAACKQPLKDLKTDLAIFAQLYDESLRALADEVEIGETDGVAAYTQAHDDTVTTLAAMNDTVRDCLTGLTAAGSQILADFNFTPLLVPATVQPGGRGVHDQVLLKVEKTYDGAFKKVAKSLSKFDDTIEELTLGGDDEVRANVALVRPQLPAVNAPSAPGGGAPPPAPPRPLQLLVLVAVAPAQIGTEGSILLGGTAPSSNEYDARIDGPGGSNATLPIAVTPADGSWAVAFDGLFAPGNYTTRVLSDCGGATYAVRGFSYPSTR